MRGARFYGRSALVGEIFDGPRNAIWVLGTRRIGKTSLLKQLEHLAGAAPERGYLPLFWDFQGAEDPSELHAGFGDALLDAEPNLESEEIGIEEIEATDLFESIAHLRRKLRSKNLRLLLLCDEVEELVKLGRKDPALLRKLRHALQASGDVRSVLASTIRLWDLAAQRDDTSPFLHGFTPPTYIGRLTGGEARSLVLQANLPAAARPRFEDDDVTTICDRCDNHPYLLQLVCKRFLEIGNLEEAIEHVAVDSMVSYFFSVDFDMLAPLERDVLRTVARESAAASDTLEDSLSVSSVTLRGALLNLDNLGFVRRDTYGKVVLANYFFRRWLTDLPAAPTSSGGSSPPGRLATDDTTIPRSGMPSVIGDRYELRREVGDGATGIVYEAYDRLLRTRIAVKLLRREYAGNRALLERFRKEILLSRNLGHPNILRVYHLGRLRHRAYLTMQWVDGPTLANALALDGPFAEPRVALLGSRIASALDAAHAHNVLHRDIKPHNIMLASDDEPLVTDFGLARLLEDPSGPTTGLFLGTPNYVSPEQALLQPLDNRSDLYSLGVVLFEIATGRCPFEGETAAEVLEMHRSQPPDDPREVAPELSPGMSRLILRCLEKDPQRRFSTADELRRALESLLPGGTAPSHSAPVVSHLGDAAAAPSPEDLLPLVYDELRRLARGFLSRERPDHTLQPTALVHEAYMRLASQSRVEWHGRTHFLAVGAKMMRRLLIDHARGRGRVKRGGGLQRVTLQEGLTPAARALGLEELLTLDSALDELAALNPRQAEIVELRFFAGMTVAEVAEHLKVSKRTVESDWAAARTWLQERLASG